MTLPNGKVTRTVVNARGSVVQVIAAVGRALEPAARYEEYDWTPIRLNTVSLPRKSGAESTRLGASVA